MQNPRVRIIQAINDKDLAWCLNKTAEIHGHFCPGSALGVMAAVCGLRGVEDGIVHSDGLENLMAVVETNACFADGIQVVSGCTLGNNALVYRDLGRLAVTFAIRGKKTGIRVRVRPDFQACIEKLVPEFYPLMKKVIMDREGGPEEEIAFKQKGWEAAFALIQLPFEELLIAEKVFPDLPGYAPITQSVVCSECGEQVMATKVVSKGEKGFLCFTCAGHQCCQVEGQGIVAKDQKI